MEIKKIIKKRARDIECVEIIANNNKVDYDTTKINKAINDFYNMLCENSLYKEIGIYNYHGLGIMLIFLQKTVGIENPHINEIINIIKKEFANNKRALCASREYLFDTLSAKKFLHKEFFERVNKETLDACEKFDKECMEILDFKTSVLELPPKSVEEYEERINDCLKNPRISTDEPYIIDNLYLQNISPYISKIHVGCLIMIEDFFYRELLKLKNAELEKERAFQYKDKIIENTKLYVNALQNSLGSDKRRDFAVTQIIDQLKEALNGSFQNYFVYY